MLGLGYVDKMRFVVLPQAFRIIIPVALSQSISLFKDTVARVDARRRRSHVPGPGACRRETYRPMEILSIAALIYFVIAFPCTVATRLLELRLATAAALTAA